MWVAQAHWCRSWGPAARGTEARGAAGAGRDGVRKAGAGRDRARETGTRRAGGRGLRSRGARVERGGHLLLAVGLARRRSWGVAVSRGQVTWRPSPWRRTRDAVTWQQPRQRAARRGDVVATAIVARVWALLVDKTPGDCSSAQVQKKKRKGKGKGKKTKTTYLLPTGMQGHAHRCLQVLQGKGEDGRRGWKREKEWNAGEWLPSSNSNICGTHSHMPQFWPPPRFCLAQLFFG